MSKLSTLPPGDWITTRSRQRPHQRCLVSPAGVLTFREVNEQVTRLAHGLRRLGLGPGDRITVLSTDSVEYVQLVMASMKVGTVLVPLNFRLTAAEITTVIAAVGPALHVSSPRYADSIASARTVSPGLRHTLMLDPARGDADLTYDELAELAGDDREIVSVTSDEDILFMMLTSGTTGTPKLVMQSQRMVRAVASSGVYEQRLRSGDFMYSGAPLFHVAGMGHIMYALICGGASLIAPQWDVETALHWLQQGGLNHCMLVPSMAMALLEHPRVGECDYPRLRSIMFGGAPLPPAVMRRMYETFACDMYNAFGSTQVGGQLVFNADDHQRAVQGDEYLYASIGRPVMGTDIRLRDEDGNDVAPGELGEIWSRSESVFSGYFNQPELTAATIVDGWYRSGDVAYMDEEGYVFLSGRADDMIIRGGENVYPVEIESVLAEYPDVLEAAVVGLDDPYWGQIVVAAVRTPQAKPLVLAEVQQFCRERLASYKVPQRLFVLADMPRNSTGKVQKFQLRQLLLAGAPEC